MASVTARAGDGARAAAGDRAVGPSNAEAEAALARLVRQRALLGQWIEPEESDATADAWALANAREAIRQERW